MIIAHKETEIGVSAFLFYIKLKFRYNDSSYKSKKKINYNIKKKKLQFRKILPFLHFFPIKTIFSVITTIQTFRKI